MDKSIYTPRSLQVAALLKCLRLDEGLASSEVAARIGRHHPYVLDYESGQRRLDVIQVMEVSWALGTTLALIAEYLTDHPPPDGVEPCGLPELANMAGGRSSSSEFDRDTWYGAERSRLCAFLRSVRQRASLNEQDVAERLDEPQSFVSKYETNKRRLDLVELEQVAHALGTALLPLVTQFERRARPYGTSAARGST